MNARRNLRDLEPALEALERVHARVTQLDASTAGELEQVLARIRAVTDAPSEGDAELEPAMDEQNRREQAESEFITNAAHELQTPLAAITSAVEVLQAGAKEVPEHRDRFLGHIQREAGRLGRLARALLVLARAQTGAEEPRREVVPLEPMLRRAASSLRAAPSVAVRVDCPAELAIFTNLELAAHALDNIGQNAAKFTSEGLIAFTARADGDGTVVIEIADTGPGIPESEREHVFDRFYRSPGAGEGGFGLGLSIVRAAANALGGHAELRPANGGGTVVRVVLPGAQRAR